MQFEWDETKNQKNKAKHGVDFSVAVRVFADFERLESYDEEHAEIEERWAVIGMVAPAVLVVIYTERHSGEVIRIISARRANEKERQAYYNR
jgi:uncharacterized DUF497 family protein